MELMGGVSPVEKNRQMLKHILLMLVGMAEMGFGRLLSLVLGEAAIAPRLGRAGKTGRKKPSPALCLPRHLYRAIVRLLRPAESAASSSRRRAASWWCCRWFFRENRSIGFRTRWPPCAASALPSICREDFARYQAELKAAERRALRPRKLNLPLLDALKNPFRIRRRYIPNHAMPRITWLDSDAPRQSLPPPPSKDDPINAAKLALRLDALGRALDNLPGLAKRFARWRARHEAWLARRKAGETAKGEKPGAPLRPMRFSALRVGKPPGCRLGRYDPDARRKKSTRDIDEILIHCHSLALYALEKPRPDTS
ncbi:hypothetical protein [Mesorhizobium sp. IMUNJ 23232]|uniref:hypothetical protein n=1 Tax=Mesorhizobium sp. IMUNJ 23232 TaxID=3376064 RepID=UPI0037B797E2